MPYTTWRLLVADDEPDICRQVKEYLDDATLTADGDERLVVETVTNFDSVTSAVEHHRVDLLILDVRMQVQAQSHEKEAGERVLEEIQQKRFIPIVFYTGLAHLVKYLETPLVRVVEKTQGLSYLEGVVQEVFQTGLPQVNRALVRHLETVQRDYMWEFVASNWEDISRDGDRLSLAYLLARRLVSSLSGPGIQQLATDLGDALVPDGDNEKVHPMRFYVLPPVEGQSPQSGDLFQGSINDTDGYWILLTPSCDMVQGREKARWVIFARCESLEQQPEFTNWQAALPNPSNNVDQALKSLLGNNRRQNQSERFYYLPGVLTLPHLLVDFQQLGTLPLNQLSNLNHMASLDSPFSEALLARFTRYFGRLGTPDLDVDGLVTRLRVDPHDNGAT